MKMDNMYYTMHSSPVKRKVLGDINNTADSPISPTANLKLLTKVASQYDSIENCNINNTSLYSIKPVIGTPPNSKLIKSEPRRLKLDPQTKETYQRKFKSLGYLCDKFLKLYPLDIPDNIDSRILLTNLANQLEVEKRRVYDIINVVESLQMATKVGKNSYSWTGHKKLADTLSQLKAYAEQVGLGQYVRNQQLKRRLCINPQDGDSDLTESSAFSENSNIASIFRNERRIGILCQKFVMLFLVSHKDGVINLDLAAQALIGGDCQQNKTRLRRLYDIANILVSLGIIAKLDGGGINCWKKPVFQYTGPHLHNLDTTSSDSFLLSNLVKAELSDGISSDLSEDSSEMFWRPEENSQNPPLVSEIDHSYSLDITKSVETPPAIVEPVAKKRLVFSSDSIKKVILSSRPTAVHVTSTTAANATRTVRVLGHGRVPQPITNGGVYKAVKVGNDIQLIRIDSS